MTWDVPNDAKKHAPFCSRSPRKASVDESYFSFADNCEVPPAGSALAQVFFSLLPSPKQTPNGRRAYRVGVPAPEPVRAIKFVTARATQRSRALPSRVSAARNRPRDSPRRFRACKDKRPDPTNVTRAPITRAVDWQGWRVAVLALQTKRPQSGRPYPTAGQSGFGCHR